MSEQIGEVRAEQAVQREKIENIEKSCKKIEHCLLGNGDPGLVLRTDRLEQKDKTRAKVAWLIFGTLVALTAKALADTLGFTF